MGTDPESEPNRHEIRMGSEGKVDREGSNEARERQSWTMTYDQIIALADNGYPVREPAQSLYDELIWQKSQADATLGSREYTTREAAIQTLQQLLDGTR